MIKNLGGKEKERGEEGRREQSQEDRDEKNKESNTIIISE